MKNKTNRPNRWTILLGTGLAVALFIAACNIPLSPTNTGDPVEQAIQTLQAQATQDFYATVVAQLTPTATLAAQPGETTVAPTQPQPTATQVPTIIVVTATPLPPTAVPPTATPIPPSPTPLPCNHGTYIDDITYPDGTKVVANTSFTKTWRVKNTGSCTWNDQYDIAFVKGDQMGAAAYYDLPKAVKPGETIDISIPMTAPASVGTYKGHWQLVNPNGVKFGTGAESKGTFWVEINVIDGKGMVYNFATSACDAKWSNSLKSNLPCPGSETSSDNGYVLTKKNPIREDGAKENEIGLITRPDDSGGGYIQGIYPAFPIKNGDRFRAALQCEGNSPKCKLKFELYYRLLDGKPTELGEWHEISDNLWSKVDIDLSALAGEKVEFYLVVWNDGTSVDNRGLWLNPIIYRP